MGQIYPIVFLHFMTFFPRLETNNALRFSSDSFPHMVIYILCGENCQNYMLTQLSLNPRETVLKCEKNAWTKDLRVKLILLQCKHAANNGIIAARHPVGKDDMLTSFQVSKTTY